MKSIQEILTYSYGSNPKLADQMAAKWIHRQLKHVPEAEQVAWAKERWDVDTLADRYGVELTDYYLQNDLDNHFDYSRFIAGVAMLCTDFYYGNGGEMNEDTARMLDKNAY